MPGPISMSLGVGARAPQPVRPETTKTETSSHSELRIPGILATLDLVGSSVEGSNGSVVTLPHPI
jgi:hypothetical protein